MDEGKVVEDGTFKKVKKTSFFKMLVRGFDDKRSHSDDENNDDEEILLDKEKNFEDDYNLGPEPEYHQPPDSPLKPPAISRKITIDDGLRRDQGLGSKFLYKKS